MNNKLFGGEIEQLKNQNDQLKDRLKNQDALFWDKMEEMEHQIHRLQTNLEGLTKFVYSELKRGDIEAIKDRLDALEDVDT